MLEMVNVVKKFGKVLALNRLNLKVDKGSLFGFIGANGAGKTTTMKIIAGILMPDAGEVYLNGKELKGNRAFVKAKIGYMPDFFGVYDNLTLMEYMEFFASLYDLNQYDARRRIINLLEMMRLIDRSDELVDGLSRGMKQRLCLARAMIHHPELLLLDEPASGMEPAARLELKQLLRKLADEGVTVIISSHVLSELSEMCDDIGIIMKGCIAMQGNKDDVIVKQKLLQPMIIKITEGGEAAMKIIKSHPLASQIAIGADISYTIKTSSISFQFLGKEEDEIELLNQLIYAGIKVLAYRRKEEDLESIFMEMTNA